MVSVVKIFYIIVQNTFFHNRYIVELLYLNVSPTIFVIPNLVKFDCTKATFYHS